MPSDPARRRLRAARQLRGGVTCAALALFQACGPAETDAPASGGAPGGGSAAPAPAATFNDSHPGVQELLNAPGFRWETLGGGRIRLHFQRGGYAALVAPDFQDGAEAILDEVLAVLGEEEASRGVRIFVLDSRGEMAALTGRTDPAWWSQELGAVVLVFNEAERPLLRRTMAPLVATDFWGNADPWLATGLGLWFDGECVGVARPLETLPAALEAAGERVDARTLVEDWEAAEAADPFSAEVSAGGLVHFLMERYSLEAVRTLWQQGSGAVLGVTGADLDALDAAWRAALQAAPAPDVELAVLRAEGGCR
ncbi:MAG: hypothetical protein WEB88_13995 [Gemmatimonadota bacterium]